MGIAPSTISEIFGGNRGIGRKHIAAFARYFRSVLVLVPVGLMSYASQWPGAEPTREKLVALCAATAIVGYPLAVLATLVEIGIHQPFGL